MILFQICAIRSWTHVITINPRTTYQLNQIFVAVVILRQNDKVIATHIAHFFDFILLGTTCDIHLTAKDGLKGLLPFSFEFFIDTIGIIEKFLNAKHIPMVGNCHTLHTISNCLIYKAFDRGLTIQNRVICMDVKVYVIIHLLIIFEA